MSNMAQKSDLYDDTNTYQNGEDDDDSDDGSDSSEEEDSNKNVGGEK